MTEAERPVPLSATSLIGATPVEPRLPPPRPVPAPSATLSAASAQPPPVRPPVTTELPSITRRRRRHVIEFMLVVLVILVVVVAAFSRDRLVQLVPAIGPILARLHVTDTSTAGLAVTVSPSRNGEALVIDGDITNGANVPRQLPRLRVALRDGNKEEVGFKEVDPPAAQLAPGAKQGAFPHDNLRAPGARRFRGQRSPLSPNRRVAAEDGGGQPSWRITVGSRAP